MCDLWFQLHFGREQSKGFPSWLFQCVVNSPPMYLADYMDGFQRKVISLKRNSRHISSLEAFQRKQATVLGPTCTS